MSDNLLKSVGEALYGPRWQSDIAHDLEVSDRTIRRWADGAPASEGVRMDLMRLCLERASRLDELADLLKGPRNRL